MLTRATVTAAIAGLVLCGATADCVAMPKKIIILRHGEKQNATALCSVGVARSQALALQYLGKDAKDSLFSGSEKPKAFLAITLHTLELASPAAATWGLPVLTFSVVPLPKGAENETKELNERTRQAVTSVLDTAAWNDETIVMVWEHKHIADKALKDTLRDLLNLGSLKGSDHVHETWQGTNYDFFWIVEFDTSAKTPTPKSFKAVQQQFTVSPYSTTVPSNAWGVPEIGILNSGCKL